MITKITTTNFMGKDICEDIGPKMIYTGENTAGKTKRSKAIILTILGFIPSPGKTIKISSDILDTLGNGQEMSTAITCGGDVFERSFKRGKKGDVKQKFKRNGKTRAKTAFMIELSKAGDPRVVDLDQFLSLSENGKIDALFELYPPDGDLSTINNDIERSKAEISRLTDEKDEANNTIKALVKSKNDTELPAGSLAETQEEIKTLLNQVEITRNLLKEHEIEDARANAKKEADEKAERDRVVAEAKAKADQAEAVEKAKKDAETKVEREKTQAALNQKMEDNTVPWTPPKDVEKQANSTPTEADRSFTNQKTPERSDGTTFPPLRLSKNETVLASIQRIIDTMNKSGCQACAAGIVAMMELKKYKVVENG